MPNDSQSFSIVHSTTKFIFLQYQNNNGYTLLTIKITSVFYFILKYSLRTNIFRSILLTWGNFMEKFWEFIKTNTKYAAKSVFLKFKEYIPFLAALFVILSVFFTIFITTATNARNVQEKLEENFDCDVIVSGLDYTQSLSVDRLLYIQSFMKKRTFESYRIERASVYEGGDYRVYVVMREGHELEDFLEYYINEPLGEASNVTVTTTPLYEHKISARANSDSPPLLLIAFICAISVAAIAALYSTRINSKKFMYGIYITLGADLKKLISTAVFEMMLLALVAFIPSALLTYLFAYLAYAKFAIIPAIKLGILIKVLICIFIISVIGAYLPMKMVSKKTPLSLISSEDNANLASSPRRSVDLLGRIFPKHYEFLSLWRFRKHYAKILLTSVLFTSVFVCGIYVSDMFETSVSQPIYEFTVLNNFEADEAEQKYDVSCIHKTVSEIEKVYGVTWEVSTPAASNYSFMLLPKASRSNSGGVTASTVNLECIDENMQKAYGEYRSQKFTSITNSFKYSSLDESTISYIENNYAVVGDIRSVLNKSDHIVISEDIFNEKRFNFKVGDKIILAKHVEALDTYGGDLFDTIGYLHYLAEDNTYEFFEYTIGAVIKDYSGSDGLFTVGMNESDYKKLTGSSVIPKTIDIILDADTSISEAEEINERLVSLFYYMGSDYQLTRSYEATTRNITKEENQRTFAVLLSALVVIMCPVVWFFSQTAFFSKRRKELYVLRAYGAKEGDIRKMFNYSGGVMSVAGFVMATLLSLPASYLIFMTMNTWLPSLGFISSNVNYSFYLSPIAVIFCAAISAASGFLSALIPYKLSIKKKNQTSQGNEYGGDENQ